VRIFRCCLYLSRPQAVSWILNSFFPNIW
jgi:hypothetical protein